MKECARNRPNPDCGESTKQWVNAKFTFSEGKSEYGISGK